MKLPRLRTLLLIPVVAAVGIYVAGLVAYSLVDREPVAPVARSAGARTIAIFGASGTAGDGLLKASLADPNIGEIRVFTRRMTPRMEEGVSAGKVVATIHMDYLDYGAIRDALADVEAVFWAIGISSLKVDDETYGLIHVDFPVAFVEEWIAVNELPHATFHYISSSDISEDSNAHWAREKVRAEKALFALAENTPLRVIAYRPDYIGPTAEEATLGQDLLYGFFAPVGAAVKARQIGQAMLEVTAHGDAFDNGDKLGTLSIIRYSDAYELRTGARGHER